MWAASMRVAVSEPDFFAAADHLIAQTVVYNTDTTISSNTSATVAVVTAGATVTVTAAPPPVPERAAA